MGGSKFFNGLHFEGTLQIGRRFRFPASLDGIIQYLEDWD
jgi:hypothetical protein